MRKLLQHITALVAIVLLLSTYACSNHPQASGLIEAEKVMKERPDSALLILNNMENIDQLSEKGHATYCLLLTQAQDLNYITHSSDSLKKLQRLILRNIKIRIKQVLRIIIWDASMLIYMTH